MLCREDNDKVSGGKFRKIFFNFPENTNEKLWERRYLQSVHLALLLKVSPEIKILVLWPGSFFLLITIGK